MAAGPASPSATRHLAGLRVRWEDSPLAEVQPASELLSVLGRLLHGDHAELKVAVVRELADQGAGPWTIEQLQERLGWLEGPLAASTVRELRDAGVLQPRRRRYVLTPAGRSVMWMLDVICRPGDPSAVIHELDALIAYAQHRGDGWPVVKHRVAMAIGHLRDTRSTLAALLEDGKPDAVLSAALAAQQARDQMQALHEHHAQLLDRHRLDADAGPLLIDSAELVGEISQLIFRAHRSLASDVAELRGLGARVGRQWVEEFADGLDGQGLEDLLQAAPSPPVVVSAALGEALVTLRKRLGRREQRVPSPPALTELPHVGAETLVDELEPFTEELAALEEVTPIEQVLLSDDWPRALARGVMLLEAGSVGDSARLPRLRVRSGRQRLVQRAGVRGVPEAHLHPRTGA